MLYGSGALLVCSGVFHIIVWLIIGGEWEGSVSWRKPILFGISTGLTVISIAWLYPKLRPRRGDTIICGLFGFAMITEVALITAQQWRGVESHFNHSTPLDAWIETLMTALIAFATLVLADLTLRSFRSLDASTDVRLAIRGGMSLLMVSCIIGFVILYYGFSQVAIGSDPSKYGGAGVTKFPHGVAIHAIQFFPIACWLLSVAGLSEKRRTRTIGFLVASTTTFLVFSLVQTLGGRARFDLTPVSTTVLTAALLFLLGAASQLFALRQTSSETTCIG